MGKNEAPPPPPPSGILRLHSRDGVFLRHAREPPPLGGGREGGREGRKEAPLDARDLWKRNVRKRERRKEVQYSAGGSCDIGGHIVRRREIKKRIDSTVTELAYITIAHLLHRMAFRCDSLKHTHTHTAMFPMLLISPFLGWRWLDYRACDVIGRILQSKVFFLWN